MAQQQLFPVLFTGGYGYPDVLVNGVLYRKRGFVMPEFQTATMYFDHTKYLPVNVSTDGQSVTIENFIYDKRPPYSPPPLYPKNKKLVINRQVNDQIVSGIENKYLIFGIFGILAWYLTKK